MRVFFFLFLLLFLIISTIYLFIESFHANSTNIFVQIVKLLTIILQTFKTNTIDMVMIMVELEFSIQALNTNAKVLARRLEIITEVLLLQQHKGFRKGKFESKILCGSGE